MIVERRIECIKCEKMGRHINKNGLCRECQSEADNDIRRADKNNPLCITCKNRCKQNSLVEIIKCPRYYPKIDSKAVLSPVETTSEFTRGRTPAKKKEPQKGKAKKETNIAEKTGKDHKQARGRAVKKRKR